MDSKAKSTRQPSHEENVSPREAELSKFREHRTPLLFTLINGQELQGSLRWYDDQAMKIVQADRSEITIYLHAIASYKAVNQ